ncbi:cytochrome P450 [Peribacillus sp. SCS-37]|uniref:cytochrome P450 n=1 Tax=Paraperibacillus esterisolvens TaxID=3115296 RepID=UPI00390604DD
MSDQGGLSFQEGPKGKLITGNLKDFRADPLRFLRELAGYGDAVKIRFGPTESVCLLSDPEMIKQVLVTKQKSFIKARDMRSLKTILGEGLLTSEKDLHMRQRRLIQPAFKKTHIASYGQDMIDVTTEYITRWHDGEERVITQDMMDITLGIISKTMFSVDFQDGHKVLGKPLETAMRVSSSRMRGLFTPPLWVPTKKNRMYKKAIKELDETLYRIIEERRKDTQKHEDMLTILLDAKDEEDGTGMSDQQVRDELMTIFLAGHETTANALSWTFHLLSQNPEAEQKLFEELDRVLDGREPEPGDFTKLTYAQNVIWESMRIYPPGFIVGREAIEDVEIGGLQFKKGDSIMMSQWVLHNKPEYFPEPDVFRPERFENNFIKTIPAYAYFPFSGGPRVCIGNHFALMEAVLVLAVIASKYRLRPADKTTVVPYPSITLRPKGGLRMVIEKREK